VTTQKVNLQPSWLVKAKTVRVKMMSAIDSANSVNAPVDSDTNGGAAPDEVGYSRSIQDGQSLSATLQPSS